MKNIGYTIAGNKIEIEIYYEIKDLFKKHFKTAKWNHYAKVWEINNNKRNENKLKKWIEEIQNSKILDSIELARSIEKEVEFTEKDLDNLKYELKSMKSRYISALKKKEELSNTLKEIESCKEALQAIKEKINKENEEIEKKEQKIIKTINSLIDIDKAYEMKNELSNYAREPFIYAKDKDRLRGYVAEFNNMKNILQEAGLKSKGIDFMASINLNRLKDRDNPSKAEDFYSIEAI